MTQVRDLMHAGLETCPAEAGLGAIATRLAAASVHALVVVDAERRPVGVVSDTDLLAGEWLAKDAAALGALRNVRAGELMTAPPQTIDADAELAVAARRLVSERIGRLLVLDQDEPVGVLAVSDVVRHLGRRALVERRCVGDVMTRGLVVCRPETTLAACARLMSDRHSRSVVVTEPDGRAVGVVSGLSLVAAAIGDAEDSTPVAQVMEPPLTVAADATLPAAVDVMLERETNRLVVVDPGHPDALPLGLVSSMDIVAEMAAPGSVWHISEPAA